MRRKGKVVMISGYFDPLHIGHLDLIRRARELGDYLVVVINTDKQLIQKKGKCLFSEQDRIEIMRSLKLVDEVVLAIDEDRTVRETLELVKPDIFANGGDLITGKIPEQEICERLGIQIVNNLGPKLRSSSEITGLPGTYDKQDPTMDPKTFKANNGLSAGEESISRYNDPRYYSNNQ